MAALMRNGRKVTTGVMLLGRMCFHISRPLPTPSARGGAHVVHLTVAQELGPHVVGQAHPAEEAEQDDQQGHAGREDRR